VPWPWDGASEITTAGDLDAGVERGLEDAVRDRFRHGIADADGEAQRAAGDLAAHRLDEAIAEREDLVGDVSDGLADLGEHEASALAAEQRLAELVRELRELLGDRGLRDAQLRRRARHAALARDDPEVAEVVKVQAVHAVPMYRENQ
jgi:hypothetical protein